MRFLECIDFNSPTQVIKKPTREDTLLHLILRNKIQPVRDVKARSSHGCSDHKMAGFRILRGENRAKKQDHKPGSEIYLEESHGIQHWREETCKRVDWFSRITSKLKNVPFHKQNIKKRWQETCMGDEERAPD